jgi:site-specific DNA-methyltransferase (adenine-specific)
MSENHWGDVEKVNELQIEERNIKDVHPYENNPRRNDDAVEYVAKSIEEFGWQQPIVVDSEGVVIVGHTRLKAAQQLGLKTVPVHVASELTEEQARAYRIADNKTSDFSLWDNTLLLSELDSIGEDIFTGFETSELFDFKFDEKNNDVLENNEDGVFYELRIRSANLELLEQTKAFYDGGGIEC